MKMASNTREGVSQSTRAGDVTATAGGPDASKDNSDPFLPVTESAIDEDSLQESRDANKECRFSFARSQSTRL